MNTHLDSVGMWIREELDAPPRESSDSTLKLGVINQAERNARRQRMLKRVTAGAAACALCVCTVTAYRGHSATRERPIEYRVADNVAPAPFGQYVAPVANQPLVLRFSEGSVIEIEPGARARVAQATARGATVLLETGVAHVNVLHRPRAEWTVLAGPYTVHVTGTAFNVDFQAPTQRFELIMRSGVVSVEGPGLPNPVEVRGKQRLIHYVGDVSFDRQESAKPPVSQPESTVADVGAVSATQPDHLDQAGTRSTIGSTGAGSGVAKNDGRRGGWSTEVARGEYASVLRQAREKGWSQVLDDGTTADLMAVANAARFLGNADASRQALGAVRRRFKGSYAAQSAAYLLGRLAEPASAREAISWYEQYERESPNGPLIAEALGRRLLLVQAQGDHTAAERAARDYVSRFPDGPYVGVARKIVLP